MPKIIVEKNPTREKLKTLGVLDWPIWTKEASQFPWSYDESETCYFLEGDVTVTPENGEPVKMGKGDLVTFPKGMSCTWKIRKDVKKHYVFGQQPREIFDCGIRNVDCSLRPLGHMSGWKEEFLME